MAISPKLHNRRPCNRRPSRGRVKVACFKGTMDLGANLAMGLGDVSESGVRLVLRCDLEKGQEVTLSLEGPEHRRPIKLRGTVVWSLPLEGGFFQVGVKLDNYLLYADILKVT